MLNKLLEKYEATPFNDNLNYMLLSVSLIKPTVENAESFNEVLNACKEEIPNKIKRTKSGGISKSFIRFPMYDYTISKSGAEITIVGWYGKCYRIQFRALAKMDESKDVMPGHKAYILFRKHLEKFNINLDDYAVDNGKELNESTQRYLIYINPVYFGQTLNNVHHLDFHSSFPAGIALTHPELKDAINDLYINRKVKPENKAILNAVIGYFHSPYIGYKYALLSHDAINNNNERILDLIRKLSKSGRRVLGVNTDGIWYQGELYHDENEGPNLGQWAHDYINRVWRAKSSGCYEHKAADGSDYKPVMRGQSLLDRIKPRDTWEWGDIFNAPEIIFKATQEGIIYEKAI